MKKTIAVLMIFLLCLSLLLPAAQGADAEPDYTAKLSADLIKNMEGKADDARIRVQIELDAPNLRDLDAKPAEMPATVEEWAASKEARYQQYLRECSAIYDPFVQTYLNDPEDLVYLQPDYCFVLSTIPKSRIVALAKLPEVRSICRGYGYEPYTPKDGEEIDPAVLAKLDIFLLGQMQTSPDDAMIPISIDLAAPSGEEIDATVPMPVTDSGSTLEQLNAYESAKRQAKREVFSAITTAFVENYLDENDHVRFRGNYIPSVTVEVPKPKVFLLAALEEVTQITWAGSDAPAYPTGTEASDSPEEPDYTEKLSSSLIKNMETAAEDARIPIAVQLVSPSSEEIEAMIPIPQPDVHPPVTIEEVNAYIAAKRAVELEVYSAITTAFVEDHLDENDTIRYQGRYLPIVKCTVPKSKILSLAALEEVSAIDYISMSLIQPVVRDEEAAKAKMTEPMKDYIETAADDDPVPIIVDLHMPSEEIMERIVPVPKPGEDASQEEIDAYNAAYQETWRYQVSLRTDTFANSTLMDTEQVYYIGEDDATVICEVSGRRVMDLAFMQEITHIDLAGVAAEEPEDPGEPVNYDALNQAIAEAEKLQWNDYTGSTADAVYVALRDAKKVLQSTSQQEVDDAAQALRDALAALELRPVLNWTELNELVAIVNALDSNSYTTESFMEFLDLKGGICLDDLVSAETQDELDRAAQKLREALAALETPSHKELGDLLAVANEQSEAEYTDYSWATFLEARSAAEAVYGDDSSTEYDCIEAAELLRDAMAWLDYKDAPATDYFADGDFATDLWTVLREDKASYNVEVGKGLVLPTQRYDIYGDGHDHWKNLFTMPAKGEWSAVAKVVYPKAPTQNDQQAVMLVWQDEDNYIRINCQQSSLKVEPGVEAGGSFSGTGFQQSNAASSADGSVTVYFRIEKQGTAYTLGYSQDGDDFTTLGTASADYENPCIGLIATANSEDGANDPIDTYVEYVYVRNSHRVPELRTMPPRPHEMRQWAVDNVASYIRDALPRATDSNLPALLPAPHGYTVELTSSDPDVIAPDGTVTQRDTEQQAILTVTVSENGVSAAMNKRVIVPAKGEPALDKTVLRSTIFRAEIFDLGAYTASTAAALETALANAKNVLENATDQTAIDDADRALTYAIQDLRRDPEAMNRTFLRRALVDAEALDPADYTEASAQALADGIAAARDALENAKDQAAVDAAVDALRDVMDQLEKKSCEHDYAAVVTEPTCTEAGCTTHTCTKCGDSYTDSEVAALGHDWDDGVIAIEPSETGPGYFLYTCKRCGETKAIKIPRIGPMLNDDIDFSKSEDYYEIVNENNARRTEDGLVIQPTAEENEDVIRIELCCTVPWSATLEFDFKQNGSNGKDQFLGFYVAEGEDDQNLCGIGAGKDAFEDLLRQNGGEIVANTEGRSSAPGLDADGTYWLRIAYLDGAYICSRSADGENFTEMFRYENSGVEDNYLIIDAYSGMSLGYTFTLKNLYFDLADELADMTELVKAVAAAKQADRSKYTDASLVALDTVLTDALAILADEHSPQEDVDAAAKALNDVIAALEEKPDEPFRFDDVKNSGKFYYEPVYWAYNHKPQITKGVDDTHFGPDQGCTRGQVVTFLWRTAGCPEPTKTENPFGDVKKSAFYYKAVLWAVENGVTKGTSNTTFSPNATCTRGQIVTFLYRANGTPEIAQKDNPFKDVADGQYFTNAVLWAVEKGVTKGKTADEFSPDATCTRGEVVTFLYRAMSDPKADDPNPVEPEPALTEVNAMLIRGPSKNGNDTLPTQTVTVSSAKELQDFLESCYDINHVIGLAADKYSDAYFVNNVLLLTPIRVCGSSPGFTITSVTEKEDQIEVELAKPGDPESPDMCAWVLLIEAAKSMPEREIVIHTTYGQRPE